VRFLFSPFGTAGDVYPMLGAAIELKSRGHEVTFITNGYFEEAVTRHGIEYVELGTKQEFLDSTANADLWHPMRGFRHVFETLIASALGRQYEAFERLFQRGPALGIVNVFGFGGLLAREKLGVPIVTLHVQPAVIWSRTEPPRLPGIRGPRWVQDLQFRLGERLFIDRTVCPRLNELRRELGLPSVRRIAHWWHSPDGVVCTFPDWYAAAQPDWPANTVQTDFPLWDEDAEELPDEIESFLAAGSPPLVFTPGSGNQFGAKFFQAAVEAAGRLQRRAILCTPFPQHVPGNLPTDVIRSEYAPFSRLLPRAAAMVHHGGVGTTAQALAAGIPQLIMPLAHDQFDNAARVARLGVGDTLLPARFTGKALARKLEPLLTSPDVAAHCQTIAARLAQRDGCQRTALVLEGWAAA
jgi:rhamnosyltransferase subunit B